MMQGLTNALKGIGGEFEITRLLAAFGVLVYVLGAHAFVVWTMIRGGEFDLVAYCTAFPTGLAVAVGGGAGATALKDRNVAAAKVKVAQAETDASARAKPDNPDGDAA